MTLKSLIESDIDDVFMNTDDFAASIESHSPDGGAKVVFAAALAGGPSFRIEKDQYHEVKRRIVSMLIKKSATDGISEIKRGWYIKYLGVKWDFDEVVFEDDESSVIQFQQSTVINSGRVNIGV